MLCLSTSFSDLVNYLKRRRYCKWSLFVRFFTEYHVNLWLIIANETLTLDLLNSTSQQYKTLEAKVVYEVEIIEF